MEKTLFLEFEDWETEDPHALYYLATGTKPSEIPEHELREDISNKIDTIFLKLTQAQQKTATLFLEQLMIQRHLIPENGSENFGPKAKHAVLMQKLITSRNMHQPLQSYIQYLIDLSRDSLPLP